MKTPLIFLDINGVLNSETTDFGPDVAPLDPVNIAPFNRIIEATSAKVVITSDWRFSLSLESIASLFEEASIRGEIIDMFPVLFPVLFGDDPPIDIEVDRGEEIESWLEESGRTDNGKSDWQFVILDETSDVVLHSDRHVKTRPDLGLTEADADRVIAMLQ